MSLWLCCIVTFVLVSVVPWKNSCLYAVVHSRYVCVPKTHRPYCHWVEPRSPLFNGGRLLTRTIRIDCFVTYYPDCFNFIRLCFAWRVAQTSGIVVHCTRAADNCRLPPIHGVWLRRKNGETIVMAY